MKFAFAFLAAFLGVAAPAFAQADDLALLRESLRLPTMPFWVGVMFDPQRGVAWSVDLEPDFGELRKLEAGLSDKAEDAPKWRDVIVGYQRLQRTKDHQRACEKSLASFKKLGAARPNDVQVGLLALDGKALPGDPWNLKWLEDFEKKHPASADIRARMAVEKIGKAVRILSGDDMVKLILMQSLLAYSQDPQRERKADEALALVRAATSDYREARKRAGTPNAGLLVQEADSLSTAYIIERVYAGRPYSKAMAGGVREALDLLRQAQEREPRSPEVLAFTLNVLRVTGKDLGESKEMHDFHNAQIDRLKALAEDATQPRVAALAHEVLAGFVGLKEGIPRALPNFKQAATLDPSRTRSVEILIPLLDLENEKEEALRRARAYIEWRDTQRARYLLAKTLHMNKQPKEAMEQLKVIVERDPEDVRGRLGSAIVALQLHHEDKKSVEFARANLEWALKHPGLDEDQKTETQKARAAYAALTGDKAGAVRILSALAERSNADPHAKLMLLALRGFSEPATPGLSRWQRESICNRLPKPGPKSGLTFRFGKEVGFGWDDEIQSEPDQVKALLDLEQRQSLDGEHLHRLGTLLERLDKKSEANQRYQQARTWAEKKMQGDRYDGRWQLVAALAKLDGDALAQDAMKDKQFDYNAQKEALLTELSQRCPGTWQIWSTLAGMHYDRATAALLGFDRLAHKDFGPFLATAQTGRPTADQLRVARQHLQLGAGYAKKAVAAAPENNTEVYARRFNHRLMPIFLAHFLKVTEDLTEYVDPNDAVNDLMDIARRRPDDTSYCTKAVLLKVAFTAVQVESKSKLSEWREFVPAAQRAWIEKILSHVESVSSKKEDAKAAAEACENLVRWHFVLIPNAGKMLDYARRAVELDPQRPATWELLALALMANRQKDECLRVCRERVRRYPNADAHLFLAFMLLEDNRLEESRKELETALKLDPKSISGQVALLALNLHLSLTDPDAMTRAKSAFEVLKTRDERDLSRDEKQQCKIMEAAYWALEGQYALAERLLGELVKEKEDDAVAKDLLRILRNAPLSGN